MKYLKSYNEKIDEQILKKFIKIIENQLLNYPVYYEDEEDYDFFDSISDIEKLDFVWKIDGEYELSELFDIKERFENISETYELSLKVMGFSKNDYEEGDNRIIFELTIKFDEELKSKINLGLF